MKAATVTFMAVVFLAAFASAATTTTTYNATSSTGQVLNITYNCSSTGNGTACASVLGISSCCALFIGTKTNATSQAVTTYTSTFCATRVFVDALSGSTSIAGYKGTLSCVNSGILTKVTALILSIGLFSVFA